MSVQALGIDRLSIADRLELIEQIWNGLPEQVALSEIPPWHLAELAGWRAVAEAHPRMGKLCREVLGPREANS